MDSKISNFYLKYLRIRCLTPRLEIRPFKDTDYQAWSQGYRNRLPKQNLFDSDDLPDEKLSPKGFRNFLKHQEETAKRDRVYIFGVFDRHSGVSLGSIDLLIICRGPLQWANLGYEIHNQYWGMGYASEAACEVLRVCFHDFKLHRVEASAPVGHAASLRVAQKIGMKEECVRKNFLYRDGQWDDCLVFSCIHQE